MLSCIENFCEYIGSEITTEHFNIAVERVEEKRKRSTTTIERLKN